MNRRSRELSRPRRPFLSRRAPPATTIHPTCSFAALSGSAQLSPSEQNVNSTRRHRCGSSNRNHRIHSSNDERAPSFQPTSPPDNLRISSEPMNVLAAQAQARFAAEPDTSPRKTPPRSFTPFPTPCHPRRPQTRRRRKPTLRLRRRLPQPHPLRRTRYPFKPARRIP